MRRLLKSALSSLLGASRSQDLIDRIRGRRLSFSESTLIEAYFTAHPRKGVMIDVGAHFGESLEPYLKRGWNVHAFEPDAKNRTELLRRVGRPRGLHLSDLAVSDHEEKAVPFFASEESHGISSLSAFRDTHREVARVDLTTLAKALSPTNAPGIDFLKIDAEGHDLFVLRGFPWTRFQPEVVLCEFEDRKTLPLGYDHRTLGDFLIQMGYQVLISEWAPIVQYGTSHQWRHCHRYPRPLDDPSGWGNFVALRNGSDLGPIQSFLSRFQADPL